MNRTGTGPDPDRSDTGGTPAFSVFPLLFTDDPATLIALLEELGMVPLVTGGNGGYADLVAGGGGHVMVHPAASSATGSPAGETQLSTSVADLELAAAHLRAQGLEVRIWDEAYGRQGSVVGPHGEGVGLNEEQEDLYGYRAHDAGSADARLSVATVRPSSAGPPRERDIDFFAACGFAPVEAGDRWWQELRAPGGGSIGLHGPAPGEAVSRPSGEAGFEDVPLVRLGFSTSEDLDALAGRLLAAGYDARRVDAQGVSSVHVTDPDGRHLEVHPRAAR